LADRLTSPQTEAADRTPAMPPADAEKLVSMEGITKYFGALRVLHEVDFSLLRGEVHCLLGENGAGKSTLMNVLYGMFQPDDGEITVFGRRTQVESPRQAIHLGIGMVHQQLMLVPTQTLEENVLLGELGSWESSRHGEKIDRLRALIADYDLAVDPKALVGSLSLGQRQQVEIIKALYRESKVLILDEPTSVLTPPEVENLFAMLRRLTAKGLAIVLITHKLHEVLNIADRVTVLRKGEAVGTTSGTVATTKAGLMRWMFGEVVPEDQELEEAPAAAARGDERPLLAVRSLRAESESGVSVLDGVSLELRAGEILGIAGVSGNGQTEFAEVLAGVRALQSGTIEFDGQPVVDSDPRARRKAGIVYAPEDRDAGLARDLSIRENLILADYHEPGFNRFGLMRRQALNAYAEELVERFRIPTGRLDNAVRMLSGGNQQRVILARALARKPSCVIAVQATIGLDAATANYVHALIRGVAKGGGCVLYVSTDLDELIELTDRIAVMYRGRIVGVHDRSAFDIGEIGSLMCTGESAA
jgi:general nucleoside transport system ATP-binding protein